MFHFTGQLDAYSEKQFLTYVSDVLKANASSLVIDLSKIDFLDSSGLGAMVQLAKQCNDTKGCERCRYNPGMEIDSYIHAFD